MTPLTTAQAREEMRQQWAITMAERFRVTIRQEGTEFVARDSLGQKKDLAEVGLITPDMAPMQVAATLFWHSLKDKP